MLLGNQFNLDFIGRQNSLSPLSPNLNNQYQNSPDCQKHRQLEKYYF